MKNFVKNEVDGLYYDDIAVSVPGSVTFKIAPIEDRHLWNIQQLENRRKIQMDATARAVAQLNRKPSLIIVALDALKAFLGS